MDIAQILPWMDDLLGRLPDDRWRLLHLIYKYDQEIPMYWLSERTGQTVDQVYGTLSEFSRLQFVALSGEYASKPKKFIIDPPQLALEKDAFKRYGIRTDGHVDTACGISPMDSARIIFLKYWVLGYSPQIRRVAEVGHTYVASPSCAYGMNNFVKENAFQYPDLTYEQVNTYGTDMTAACFDRSAWKGIRKMVDLEMSINMNDQVQTYPMEDLLKPYCPWLTEYL